MVKIMQAYNFAKQNTFSLNGEILAATLLDSNRIAISSAEQFIEIYDVGGKQRQLNEHLVSSPLNTDTANANSTSGNQIPDAQRDDRLPTKYSLATVGDVVNLIYCETGKYLLTLEKENVGSPVHTNNTSISCTSSNNTTTINSDDDTKMFVRIYANIWRFADAKLIDLPITIRIASMTTPKAPLVESIDVIELPLRSSPDLIQCCQTSGNIIVSSKDRIYLYEYTQCIHENTQPHFSYIDFLPFKFFVNLNFTPLKLSVAENVIACMNNRYCVAFKVIDVANGCAGAGARGGLSSNAFDYNDYSDNGDNVVGDGDVDEAATTSESSILSRASVGRSSHNSFEFDSMETTSSGRPTGGRVACFPGRTPIDFNVARMVNSACGREFEVDMKSQWEQNDSLNYGSSLGGDCGGAVACESQEIIITPTRANDIKIKLVNEAKAMNVQRISSHGNIISAHHDDDTTVQYVIRKLLQICMKSSDPSGRVVDILRCMDLKAIYQRPPMTSNNGTMPMSPEEAQYDMGNQQMPSAITTTKHANRRTLRSLKHQSCIGYALIVASSVDGYLYQFCAQGKWYNENEKPIATYSFTAPVLKVHINDYVIYAVTTESVETHTSRIGHKLFNNRFEYPSIGSLFPEESSPDVSSAVAVIGLCSFMHVQYVCVNRENVVLITNSALASATGGGGNQSADGRTVNGKRRSGGGETKRNIASRLLAEAKAKHSLLRSGTTMQAASSVNEWTLYNLEVPQVQCIIDDLTAIAESYRTASTTNFYDLMEEAHVMLRLSLSLQCEKLGADSEKELHEKFMNNCRKLADFSVRSNKKEIYLQATGFYKMCNLPLIDVYANYVEQSLQLNENIVSTTKAAPKTLAEKITSENLIGLIYTVKMFLLSLGTDRQKAAFLNNLVNPFFTPNRVIQQGYPQVPLSLEFLNMLIKYSAADVPQIMLNSPVVADAISGEIINYLKYLDELTPDENLLLAVTACRMSNYILSQETVSKASRRDLAVALIKYKNVLFDDGTVLFQNRRSDGKLTNNTRVPFGEQQVKQTSQNMRRQPKRKLSLGCSVANMQAHNNIVSFSEFTDSILLATDNVDLIEAISDAFIQALCIEHSITLDTILQLFLNYIASHIGHKGYQTSQKVFVNILQVYYYDLFDVNPISNRNDLPSNTPPPPNMIDDDYDDSSLKAPSLSSERDNESIANSIGESNSGASSYAEERSLPNRQNRIVYDQLQEQNSPFKCNSYASPSNQNNHDQEQQQQFCPNDSDINMKGLKILFRMYLGRLKALSDLITGLQSADIEQQTTNDEFLQLRTECIKFMQ